MGQQLSYVEYNSALLKAREYLSIGFTPCDILLVKHAKKAVAKNKTSIQTFNMHTPFADGTGEPLSRDLRS